MSQGNDFIWRPTRIIVTFLSKDRQETTLEEAAYVVQREEDAEDGSPVHVVEREICQ